VIDSQQTVIVYENEYAKKRTRFLFLKGAFFIMAKTKTDKITGIEKQIEQLENERKKLLQEQKEQERKDRTKRLCKRGGLLESMLPDTVPLTDEQFKTFMEKTMLTDFTRRILDGLTAQGTTPPAAKPAESAQNGGTVKGADEGNGTRVSG
jgi:hypothetical protein